MHSYTAYPSNISELKSSQNQAADMIGQQRQTFGTELDHSSKNTLEQIHCAMGDGVCEVDRGQSSRMQVILRQFNSVAALVRPVSTRCACLCGVVPGTLACAFHSYHTPIARRIEDEVEKVGPIAETIRRAHFKSNRASDPHVTS